MKKKGILLSFFIILIMITTYAYAAVSIDTVTDISNNKNVYEQGETFVVDFKLANYSFDRKGIDEFVIKMNIDKNIIEPLTVQSIVTENGTIVIGENQLHVEDINNATHDEVIFSDLATDCDYKVFIDLNKPYSMDDFNANPVLMKFKFKVKSNAPVVTDSSVVKFTTEVATQVTAADLKNNFSADRATGIKDEVFISVEKASISTPSENVIENTTNKVTNTQNNKVNNTSTNRTNNTTNKVTNTQNNKINSTEKNNTVSNTNKQNTVNSTNKNNVTNTQNNKTNQVTNNPSTTTKNNTTDNKSQTSTSDNKVSSVLSSAKNAVSANTPNANTANTVIPKAGAKLFILPVAVVLILAGVFYSKVKKYKDID